MAINIKNAEVEEAVRALARSRGVDLTEAIRIAVSHELLADARQQTRKITRMRLASARMTALPVLDNRTADEILAYNAYGVAE